MHVEQLLKLCVWSSLLLIHGFDEVETIEPITTAIAVGTAAFGSAIFANYDSVKCHFYECCSNPWLLKNMTGLKYELEQNLHGQHLVVDIVTRALSAHLNKDDPDKALVLSFHGWTGGGKNYVSRFIAEHLFKKGLSSQYVTIFVATLDFPHESKVETYKDQLRETIKATVYRCPRSLFIFDEMDKMPAGLIDAIKPYLDHYPEINGINYRKSIFLFLSNTAGNDITKHTLQHWASGHKREDLDRKGMEEIITVGAFNEDGGLWHSSLIEKNLITAFVPFLPLERRHIKLCARDVLRTRDVPVTKKLLDKVADELQFFPADTKLYSKSGCKRVSEKVDFVLEDLF